MKHGKGARPGKHYLPDHLAGVKGARARQHLPTIQFAGKPKYLLPKERERAPGFFASLFLKRASSMAPIVGRAVVRKDAKSVARAPKKGQPIQ